MIRRRIPRVMVLTGSEPSTITVVVLMCLAVLVVAYGNWHERQRGNQIESDLRHLRVDDGRTIADLRNRTAQLEDCIRDPGCVTVPTIPPTTRPPSPTVRPARPRATTGPGSTDAPRTTTTMTRRTTTSTSLVCPAPTIPVNGMCVVPPPATVP